MSEQNPNDQAGDPAATGLGTQSVSMNNPFNYSPPKDPDGTKKEVPVNSEQANEDHHGRIAELAIQLRNASPSGANTISDKILYHLNAIEHPEEHNKAEAELKKAEDEREAERKKARDEAKAKMNEKSKAA